MTTGEFTSFLVHEIWVDRAKRQRRELQRIPELAASIKASGLIHPPVIKRDGELIVGERRWTAVKTLGWSHIPVQFIDELSELEFHLVEFEENIRRIDLPWQEQCLALEKYHQLKLEQDPTWTATKTAEALGMSNPNVVNYRAVAKEINSGNELVKTAPKLSTAVSITSRKTQRQQASIVAAIAKIEDPKKDAVKAAPLLNEDFHKWTAAYCGRPFNFLHCDFPYGVGMDNSDQGAGSSFGTYADSPDDYWRLLETLAQAMGNVVADSAHLMFWFSMDYYADTKTALEKMGWKVNPFPLVWVKSDNTGIIPDAKRGPRRIYETAFFGTRGDRFVHAPVSNAFSHPGRGERSLHMNEKPVPMLRHFIRMFVDEYSTVLDPTCGSGNALKAASLCGAPTVLGIEQNTEFFNLAKEAYFNVVDVPNIAL